MGFGELSYPHSWVFMWNRCKHILWEWNQLARLQCHRRESLERLAFTEDTSQNMDKRNSRNSFREVISNRRLHATNHDSSIITIKAGSAEHQLIYRKCEPVSEVTERDFNRRLVAIRRKYHVYWKSRLREDKAEWVRFSRMTFSHSNQPYLTWHVFLGFDSWWFKGLVVRVVYSCNCQADFLYVTELLVGSTNNFLKWFHLHTCAQLPFDSEYTT